MSVLMKKCIILCIIHPILFMDVIPAIAYNQVIAAADAVRMRYEEAYGPLCSFRSYAANTQDWQWKDNPWPWQQAANFSLAGKECR